MLRERETRNVYHNVMTLEARWNLVLKRDCWLTMDCEKFDSMRVDSMRFGSMRVEVGRYRLFGNAGFEFSDASSYGFVWNCNFCVLQHVNPLEMT